MMNSALVHAYTSAQGKTLLAELLAKKKTDERDRDRPVRATCWPASRRPRSWPPASGTSRKVGNRKEALEDVLWALVNSTEFLFKK